MLLAESAAAEHQRVLQGCRHEATAYAMIAIQRRVTANNCSGEAADNHIGVCVQQSQILNKSTDGREHSSVCNRQSLLRAKHQRVLQEFRYESLA